MPHGSQTRGRGFEPDVGHRRFENTRVSARVPARRRYEDQRAEVRHEGQDVFLTEMKEDSGRPLV